MKAFTSFFSSPSHSSHFARHKLTLLAPLLGLVVSCSEAEEVRPENEAQPSAPAQSNCSEGATRSCGITLESENGVMLCYRGVQSCKNKRWGACEEGEITEEVNPAAYPSSSLDLKAFAPPIGGWESQKSCGEAPDVMACDALADYDGTGLSGVGGASGTMRYSSGDEVINGGVHYQCSDSDKCNYDPSYSEPPIGTNWQEAWDVIGSCRSLNPCDPSCMFYDENPDPDLEGTPTMVTTASGTPDYPGFSGVQACDHDLCTTGAALPGPPTDNACHECVAEVCAVDSDCCTSAWEKTYKKTQRR